MTGTQKRIKTSENVFKYLFLACAIVGILAVMTISVYLLATGIPAIAEIGFFKFIFGTKWNPKLNEYGILPMIVSTIYVTAFAVVFGVVIGVFAAIFMAKFCPKKIFRLMKQGINLLAGIPSVVYGFFGVQMIVPLLGVFSDNGSGYGLLASGLILGIMILPTVVSISLTSIMAVPQSYYEGALALGATKEQATFKIIVPAAKSGIVTAVVLGITRALGETMAVVMISGNVVGFPTSLIEGLRTMTGNIVLEMGYASGLHMDALIATGVVLFVFIAIITVCFNIFMSKKKNGRNSTRQLQSVSGEPIVFTLKRTTARVMKVISAVCAGFSVACLAIIVGFILIMGIPNLSLPLLFGSFSWDGAVTMLPSLVSTLMMIVITIVISVPIGVCAAIYLSEYTKTNSKFVRAIRVCLETLSGIPSIVYGLFGMLVFCNLFGMGRSILAACFTLAIMILPTIVRTSEEAIKEVPMSYREGGIALGSSKIRVIFKLVLPSCISGIMTGVILSIGRILGESAAILFTAGASLAMPTDPMSSGANLALLVYLLAGEGFHVAEAYGVSCIVLILAVGINLIAQFVSYKFEKKIKGQKDAKKVNKVREERVCRKKKKIEA